MTDESKDLTVAARADVTAGGEVSGLIPQNIEQAYRVATAIFKSGMAPTTLNSAEKVMVAVMAGMELRLAPFQAVQSFAIINGRAVMFGDALIAVVRSQGFRVREWSEGEGDDRVAHCEVIRPDTGEVIVRHFSVVDAKQAKLWGKRGQQGQDTPWITYPERMLSMRARAFALRDGAADVLKGFSVREEVADIEVVEETPRTSLRERLEASATPRPEGFNIENPETTPEEIIAEIEPIGGEHSRAVKVEDLSPGLIEAIADARAADAPSDTEAATPASEPGTETGTPAISDAISARISAYVDRLEGAKTAPELIRFRERAADLLRTVSELDPARADALDAVFNRRHEELSEGKLL